MLQLIFNILCVINLSKKFQITTFVLYWFRQSDCTIPDDKHFTVQKLRIYEIRIKQFISSRHSNAGLKTS